MSNTLQNSHAAVVQPEFVGESPLMANRRIDDPAVQAIGSFLTADMLGWMEEINTKSRVITDVGTMNHMWRVAITAGIAAQAHGLDVVSAVVGGGLHDNAKGIPEILEIINSDRKLTPEDRRIVNLHSELGAENILQNPFEDYLLARYTGVRPLERRRARELTLQAAGTSLAHHSGDTKNPYPNIAAVVQRMSAAGMLTDEEGGRMSKCASFPLNRYMHVIDKFDAMMEPRPYRPEGMPFTKAYELILSNTSEVIPASVIHDVARMYAAPDFDTLIADHFEPAQAAVYPFPFRSGIAA